MNGIIACLQGRVARASELKWVKGGALAMVSFSLATETKEAETTWVRVVVFDELAKSLAPRLVKGCEVYAEGKLHLSAWETQDGEKRTTLELSAWTAQLMGQIGRRKPKAPKADGARKRAPQEDFNDPLNF